MKEEHNGGVCAASLLVFSFIHVRFRCARWLVTYIYLLCFSASQVSRCIGGQRPFDQGLTRIEAVQSSTLTQIETAPRQKIPFARNGMSATFIFASKPKEQLLPP